jgi:2-polyprenyl-3-methyl-5-hydroxy-6-metoxy-1,4-benzoquinol methylase
MALVGTLRTLLRFACNLCPLRILEMPNPRPPPEPGMGNLAHRAVTPSAALRFDFGRNWRSYLRQLDEPRIESATASLSTLLGCSTLAGRRFLDIGSGSGLFSLAAYRLGASVVSFDYDPEAVACAEILRRQVGADETRWRVMQGSVLDEGFLEPLGVFDVVYSWGVLHHTGAMWRALELAAQRVAPAGQLAIALYNDQGWRSRFWWHVKRLYCRGSSGRWLVSAVFYPLFALYAVGRDLAHARLPGTYAREYHRERGMSLFHDWRDWLGGFPFEVARPDEVLARLSAAGFVLQQQRLRRSWGCNEFVLRRAQG